MALNVVSALRIHAPNGEPNGPSVRIAGIGAWGVDSTGVDRLRPLAWNGTALPEFAGCKPFVPRDAPWFNQSPHILLGWILARSRCVYLFL